MLIEREGGVELRWCCDLVDGVRAGYRNSGCFPKAEAKEEEEKEEGKGRGG
jgi:hypothetical protein